MNHTTDRLEFALAPRAACIGVFDSGVGGLSILRALRERLPEAPMIYIGDVAHAPYGDRCANEVCERSQQVIEWLIDRGATMVVLACNTATVLAIEVLRLRWPSIIFVGVEPGVKPAAAQSRTRRIAVMATVATAVSKRLQQLIARHAPGVHVHVQACSGLADGIERGVLHGVVDTATAVAERSAALWNRSARPCGTAQMLRMLSTGATGTMARLIARCHGLERTPVEVLTMIPTILPG